MKKCIDIRILIVVIVTAVMGMTVGGCGNTNDMADDGPGPLVGMMQKLWPSEAAQREKLWGKLTGADADMRREAVYELGEKPASKWENTPQMLCVIVQGDPDGQVRVSALSVLATLNHDHWLPEALKSAAVDADKIVRAESIEVLGTRQDDQSMKMLLAIVAKDPESTIRAAAATSLGNYKGKKVIRTLIDGLLDDNFSVNYRSRQSLKKITGQDFSYDDQGWLQWLAEAK